MKTEKEIIEGCLKQKASAQEALYKLYSRRMMAVCLRYTKSRFEAEDIFHEAFVKAFKNIPKWQGGSFEGWMRRIFVNTAINHYHRNKKYFDHLNSSYAETVVSLNEDVISQLSNQELLEVINKLPEGYRLIFNLYVIEGYNHKEIAEMLKIAEGTSKSQLAKARAYLKNLLEDNLISAAC
ncbi:MAG: RNA polymerase sigma factor [Candidatus Cyclobacteriaceae bacterium M2_1C_046]